jgi:hypothetical protein
MDSLTFFNCWNYRYYLQKWVWQLCGLISGKSQRIFPYTIELHPANKGLLFICFFIASGLIPFCMFDVWKGLKNCPLFASNWQYSQVGGEGGDTLCRNWAACSRAIFVREMRIIRAMYLSTVGDSQAWAPCKIKTRYKIPMSLPTLQNSLPQVYVLYTISTNNGLSSHDGWINFDALEEIQLFCECICLVCNLRPAKGLYV